MSFFCPSRNDLLYQAQQGKCFHCGKHMGSYVYEKTSPDGYTQDHIIPVKFHGKRSRNNIVLACMRCNSSRGHAYPTEEMQQRANQVNATARWIKQQKRERKLVAKFVGRG